MIHYRTATALDVAYVAANLRPADRAELHAQAGIDPGHGLRFVWMASSIAAVATVDEQPAVLFGVMPRSMVALDGIPWAMGTPLMDKHPRVVLVAGRQWLQILAMGYRRLANHVDARNLASIRWLRRLGFTIGPPEPHGPFGLAFHPFEKEF